MKRLLNALPVLLLLLSGCSLLPKEVQDAPPVLAPPVKSEKATYTVHVGDIADEVVLRATFVSARAADLSFANNGHVSAVYVRAGENVKAGQLLAEFHTEDLSTQLAQAEIRLQKAQLAIEQARYNAQFSRGEAADFQIKGLQLDLQSAQIDRDNYRAGLQAARLTAPFDGTIQSVSVKPGDAVVAFAAALSLADQSQTVIQADVDDLTLAKLAIGQPVRLEFTDLPGAGVGHLVELPAPGLGASQPKRIKVRPDAALPQAKVGMVGKVHILLQQKHGVLLLANGAIRQFSGRTYVLLEQPRREVDVVQGIQGDTETEIVKGLQNGDKVIGR